MDVLVLLDPTNFPSKHHSLLYRCPKNHSMLFLIIGFVISINLGVLVANYG